MILWQMLSQFYAIDDNIHFTCEEAREDGSIPFLDMLITPDEDGRLNTTVYRKPTHTDQYLYWDSHHAIASKYSVIGTLYHRAKQYAQTLASCRKKKNIYTNP